jgi:HTH-type transcriptional regulator, glycine betaine synthesis regulator
MNPAALNSTPASGVALAVGRTEDVVTFEQDVVDFFVEAAGILGVPRSVAAIYGIVFASPEALGFADIDARLDISKGSVSQGLRVLREMGALTIVAVNGDRREFYAPDMELRRLIERWLAERLQKQLSAGSARLAALNRSIPGLERAQQAALRHRLKYLKAWHDKAGKLLPVVRTFLALTRPR